MLALTSEGPAMAKKSDKGTKAGKSRRSGEERQIVTGQGFGVRCLRLSHITHGREFQGGWRAFDEPITPRGRR